MEILQIVGFALLATILAGIVRSSSRSELASLVAIVASLAILGILMVKIGVILRVLTDLANQSGIEWVYLRNVLKVLGVAYIAGFGAQVCRDSGEGAMAQKVELAGKVMILFVSVPVIAAVIDVIKRLMIFK